MNRVRRRAQALSRLQGAEILLFARICAFAMVVPALMRLPLPRLAAVLARAGRGSRGSAGPDTAQRLGELVDLAQQVVYPLIRRGCLPRCVTLYWFLTRAGLNVELCFGMGEEARKLPAHCWVALDGEPILERQDPRARFLELYRVPAARGV